MSLARSVRWRARLASAARTRSCAVCSAPWISPTRVLSSSNSGAPRATVAPSSARMPRMMPGTMARTSATRSPWNAMRAVHSTTGEVDRRSAEAVRIPAASSTSGARRRTTRASMAARSAPGGGA